MAIVLGNAIENAWGWPIVQTINTIVWEGFDCKQPVNSYIYIPAGAFSMRFIPFMYVFCAVDISIPVGSAGTPKFRMGTSGPEYDDLFPETQLTGLVTQNDTYTFIPPKNSKMPEYNVDDIYLVLTKQANTSGTYQVRLLVLGIDTW